MTGLKNILKRLVLLRFLGPTAKQATLVYFRCLEMKFDSFFFSNSTVNKVLSLTKQYSSYTYSNETPADNPTLGYRSIISLEWSEDVSLVAFSVIHQCIHAWEIWIHLSTNDVTYIVFCKQPLRFVSASHFLTSS